MWHWLPPTSGLVVCIFVLGYTILHGKTGGAERLCRSQKIGSREKPAFFSAPKNRAPRKAPGADFTPGGVPEASDNGSRHELAMRGDAVAPAKPDVF